MRNFTIPYYFSLGLFASLFHCRRSSFLRGLYFGLGRAVTLQAPILFTATFLVPWFYGTSFRDIYRWVGSLHSFNEPYPNRASTRRTYLTARSIPTPTVHVPHLPYSISASPPASLSLSAVPWVWLGTELERLCDLTMVLSFIVSVSMPQI
jgi:hypothetical protein